MLPQKGTKEHKNHLKILVLFVFRLALVDFGGVFVDALILATGA